MPDYSEGKIYLVKFRNDQSLVYVGSTKSPLNERFSRHKNDYDVSLYKYIHNNCHGNWDDCYIELYEDYPCLNKKELERREGEITRKFKNDSNYKCINKNIAGRNIKEWNEENKKKIICDCGCIISKGRMKSHLKSISHIIGLINKGSLN